MSPDIGPLSVQEITMFVAIGHLSTLNFVQLTSKVRRWAIQA